MEAKFVTCLLITVEVLFTGTRPQTSLYSEFYSCPSFGRECEENHELL